MEEVTYSGYWKHESACELWEVGHEVRKEFVEVLKAAAEAIDHDVEYYAAGCGCATPDAPTGVFWKAQGDATEHMMVNYGSDEIPAEEVAREVLRAAEESGVEADWTGNTRQCVCLGNSDYYDDEPCTDAGGNSEGGIA